MDMLLQSISGVLLLNLCNRLSVMVTELKEDHQHRVSIKGKKSRTSSHKGRTEKRQILACSQTHTHTHTDFSL